ncbi:CoA pyrophosphatase [Pandoraea bronchicola]|uniref:DNA mismatch repair protein MutT n=1 Tax=Pandoraea bronchicola TaxID=2508287 RepID=A0A5E5BQR8_9BURK|nr:CoA pyrophosphatase [Pandoraea bronchicola]VVE87738.1 DNA mismatch repair protein MutT [Pandoraea bronchicola]
MAPPLILHPEALPIVSTGEGEPAVPAQRLTPEALRDRLASPPIWTPESGAVELVSPSLFTPRAAAVLVPLVMRPHGTTVLLTRRTQHLSTHAGQVSFPGGSREPDDPTPIATALRESREEIGLDSGAVEVIGSLPDYVTGTGFRVAPVVGLVKPPFDLVADAGEVDEIFEVPLDFLMNPAHHQIRVFNYQVGERRFYAMPYPKPTGGEYFIWGATAGMLRNFYQLLRA